MMINFLVKNYYYFSYKHLKQLRLWKVNAGDEGVRSICNYMLKERTIEYLDLLDNKIGLLGKHDIKYTHFVL